MLAGWTNIPSDRRTETAAVTHSSCSVPQAGVINKCCMPATSRDHIQTYYWFHGSDLSNTGMIFGLSVGSIWRSGK